MSRTGTRLTVVAVICAVTACGCGGGSTPRQAAVHRQCRATIGFIGSAGEPLARQELAFARLAVANDNAGQHTRISLVAAPTGIDPVLAADRFAAQGVLAVVGPADDAQVQAVGPVFARAGIAFISGSATGATLTDGANPTFFRVVPSDSLEGPDVARLVVARARGTVMLIDDGLPSLRPFLRSIAAALRVGRIQVEPISAVEGVTPVATVAAHVSPLVTMAVVGWHVPVEADQLGRLLLAQRKAVTLVGPSQLFDPARFRTPGSYVAYPVPDITVVPAAAELVLQAQRALGSFAIDAPPAYAATHVIDAATKAVCGSGRPPSRSGILAAIRSTDEATSVLGVPIRFRPDGDLADGRWFIFRIEASGRYRMQPPL